MIHDTNAEFDEPDPYFDWYPFPKTRLGYARFFLGLKTADRRPDQSFAAGEACRWFAEVEARVRQVHRRSFWKVFAVVFILMGVFNGAFTIAYKDPGFFGVQVAIMLAVNAFVAALFGYGYVAIRGSYPLDEDGRILPWEYVPKDEDNRGY